MSFLLGLYSCSSCGHGPIRLSYRKGQGSGPAPLPTTSVGCQAVPSEVRSITKVLRSTKVFLSFYSLFKVSPEAGNAPRVPSEARYTTKVLLSVDFLSIYFLF